MESNIRRILDVGRCLHRRARDHRISIARSSESIKCEFALEVPHMVHTGLLAS